MFSWPGLHPRAQPKSDIRLVDVTPTILDVMGIDFDPTDMDGEGVSLPLAGASTSAQRRTAMRRDDMPIREHAVRSASTRSRCSVAGTWRTRSGKARFPRTSRWGCRLTSWVIIATSRSRGGRAVTSRSPIRSPSASSRRTVSCLVRPTLRSKSRGMTTIKAIAGPVTLIDAVPEVPSTEAVISACPGACAVTTPSSDTEATSGARLDQAMLRLGTGIPLAVSGAAVSCTCPPMGSAALVGSTSVRYVPSPVGTWIV